MPHNIDLHAVHGPGGGGSATEAAPGKTKAFTFKALTEGLYVYHCAVPMASNHISNGMYGLILVEPAGGLPRVDREFYVMQGELYTTGAYGQSGAQEFSYDKLMDEHPEYFVLNGAVGALTKEHPLLAKTGQTIRVYFGVGGPNITSSFHIIGTIFDRVYAAGSFGSPPLTGVQTVMVAPGSAVVVDLLPVPGRFLLVHHADRTAAGRRRSRRTRAAVEKSTMPATAASPLRRQQKRQNLESATGLEAFCHCVGTGSYSNRSCHREKGCACSGFRCRLLDGGRETGFQHSLAGFRSG